MSTNRERGALGKEFIAVLRRGDHCPKMEGA